MHVYLPGPMPSAVENSKDISRWGSVTPSEMPWTPTLNTTVAPSPSVVIYGGSMNPTVTSVFVHFLRWQQVRYWIHTRALCA